MKNINYPSIHFYDNNKGVVRSIKFESAKEAVSTTVYLMKNGYKIGRDRVWRKSEKSC